MSKFLSFCSDEFPGYNLGQLFILSDGCPGDNKNYSMFDQLTLLAEQWGLQKKVEYFQRESGHNKDE